MLCSHVGVTYLCTTPTHNEHFKDSVKWVKGSIILCSSYSQESSNKQLYYQYMCMATVTPPFFLRRAVDLFQLFCRHKCGEIKAIYNQENRSSIPMCTATSRSIPLLPSKHTCPSTLTPNFPPSNCPPPYHSQPNSWELLLITQGYLH